MCCVGLLPPPNRPASTKDQADEGYPSGRCVGVLDVRHGLRREGRRCCGDFSLAFLPLMGNNTRKWRGLSRPETIRIV